MPVTKTDTSIDVKPNKKAKKFVKFLTKNQVTSENLPIYYNDNHHAVVVLKDRMDSTAYPYSWEVIFNPLQELVVIKAVKIVESIQADLAYHILELINDKNRSILWGKFFLHNNAIYMMSPLNDSDKKLKSATILKVLKSMRLSAEELHSEILKVFL